MGSELSNSYGFRTLILYGFRTLPYMGFKTALYWFRTLLYMDQDTLICMTDISDLFRNKEKDIYAVQ